MSCILGSYAVLLGAYCTGFHGFHCYGHQYRINKMAHGSSPEKAPQEIARPVPGGFAVDGWANRASCSRDSAHFDGSLVFLSCRVVKGGQVQLGSSLMRKLTVRSMVEIPGRSL